MEGVQVPLPSGPKTSYSRASTRPTSAGTAGSDSPRARPQRPWSARSAGSREARNSVCYEDPIHSWSASDLQSAPSRPTSARSRASAAYVKRVSNVASDVARPSDSPRSSRYIEHHSLEGQIIASPDFGRRSVEEEIREPVLTPIPNSLGTPLEKQIATAIGLKGKGRLVPRLPRSAVSCKHGSDCCWRWLARAALEEIWGSSLATLSLAESVTKVKEEFAQLQAERTGLEAEQVRTKAAEEALAEVQEELNACKIDGREFRVLEREHGRLQNEAVELRTQTGKLEAQLEIQIKASSEHIAAITEKASKEAERLRSRAEIAEASAVQAQAVEQDLRERVKDLQEQLRDARSALQQDRNMMLMKKGIKKKTARRKTRSPKPSKSRSVAASPRSTSKSRSKSRRRRLRG